MTGCDDLMYAMGMVQNDVIQGDPYQYQGGVLASTLRSGVDGPHAKLADQLCNLNGRFPE